MCEDEVASAGKFQWGVQTSRIWPHERLRAGREHHFVEHPFAERDRGFFLWVRADTRRRRVGWRCRRSLVMNGDGCDHGDYNGDESHGRRRERGRACELSASESSVCGAPNCVRAARSARSGELGQAFGEIIHGRPQR
jgi:hypothetical protein